jgi:hypothetical protein
MAKPTPGSGSSQIVKSGQTSAPRFASDPHVKVKGSTDATEQSLKTKSLPGA